jgi:drug/metabolite transporter (DMT)-like permease
MTDLLISSGWVSSLGLAQLEGQYSQYIGEVAALTAAFLWAAATLMFGVLGRQLSPLVLNGVKGLFAVGFILVTLAVQTGGLKGGLATNSALPWQVTVCLLLSGGIGIGLGDTAYFSAINTLGARRALLLETLAPPMTAVLAWVFLSETLSVIAVLGIVLTLIGVAWVISERVPSSAQVKWSAGIKVALLAVLCQSAGAVLSRAALVDTAADPLWSSLLRLLAGLGFMAILAVVQPHRLGEYQPVGLSEPGELGEPGKFRERSPHESPLTKLAPQTHLPQTQPSHWKTRWHRSLSALKLAPTLSGVALAAFFGTYLGIWLQQIALKYTAAGIAQSLLATSPLFVLPMAVVLGDRVSPRAALGAFIALIGVWILLAYK